MEFSGEMSNASYDNGRQGRHVDMDMRTTAKSEIPSPSPEPSIQRIVRFDTGARQSAASVGEMASGLDFDLDTFSPLGSFTPNELRRSPVNSVMSYPDATQWEADVDCTVKHQVSQCPARQTWSYGQM